MKVLLTKSNCTDNFAQTPKDDTIAAETRRDYTL
jgi:hypothetical protein